MQLWVSITVTCVTVISSWEYQFGWTKQKYKHFKGNAEGMAIFLRHDGYVGHGSS